MPIEKLDRAQLWHAVNAISTRKLQIWMAVNWGNRKHTSEYFEKIVTAAWVLAQDGDWMTEEDFLSAWPEAIEQPHVMTLDDIERVMVDSTIAEKDPVLGTMRYRWPELPEIVRAAATDFRFSESYSIHSYEWEMFRRISLFDLFVPFPQKYGLRGDSYLWGKLAAYFESWQLSDSTEIEVAVKEGFRQITGKEFDRAPNEFFDEGLAHGGMSSGHVSMEWWRRAGLPLLISRFEALRPALPLDFHEPIKCAD